MKIKRDELIRLISRFPADAFMAVDGVGWGPNMLDDVLMMVPDDVYCTAYHLTANAEELPWVDNACEPPDWRCQCCECEEEAVGFSEGTPYCAAHYCSRG